MLDDAVRRSTGMLVAKIDPETLPSVRAELESPSARRRTRGLIVATAIGVAPHVEPLAVSLLYDDDHNVRAEAARLLGDCDSEAASAGAARRAGGFQHCREGGCRRKLATHGHAAHRREAIALRRLSWRPPMNNLTVERQRLPALAQTPFESMGSHFRGETAKLYVDDYVIGVLVIVGVVAAVGILYWLFTGAERVHRHNNPRALFRSLCGTESDFAIGFCWRRWPAIIGSTIPRLFLESARFERTGLSPALQRSAEAIGALRAMLFVEPVVAAARSKLVGFAAGVDLPAEASTATR